MGRIGQQINSKDSLNVMYFFNSSRSRSVSGFPEFTFPHFHPRPERECGGIPHFQYPPRQHLQLNFNRQRTSTLNAFAFQTDIAAGLGITGVSTNPFDWGVPAIGFTNFGGLNDHASLALPPPDTAGQRDADLEPLEAQYPHGGRITPRAAEYRD